MRYAYCTLQNWLEVFTFPSPVRRPAGAANRRLFLGYFLLATQKKVTSCRATPGGFGFD